MVSRNQVVLPMTRVLGGRMPVSSEVRDGLQSGYWQYARSNRTPLAASPSMFGDFTGRP